MTIEQAIRTGIEYEVQVRSLYAEAAKKFGDPVARKIFGVLAAEEDGHVRYLESRLAEWQRSGAVTAAALETAVPSKEAIAAAIGQLHRRIAQRDVGGELDTLKKALALETEATRFFEQMVGELTGEGQKLFARFVEVEAAHEALVQTEIDVLTGLGFWFDFAEFKLEGA